MASPDILDFARLLAPFAETNPVGQDLRGDTSPTPPYLAVKDARTANRATERQLLGSTDESAGPDWRPVLQRATAVLAEKAKDLEVTAYAIEALVRLHGFAGLRDGFRLARELVERFGEAIFPLPDEDGFSTRVAPLTGLNGEEGEGTLISPILCVPLTEAGTHPAFACYHVQQALALDQVKDENVRAKRLQDGAVTLETIEQAVAETSRDFYTRLLEDLTGCQDEFARLSQTLEDKYGGYAPPTSNIRNALTACRDALTQVADSKLPRPVQEEAAAHTETPGNGKASIQATGTAVGSTEVITSREDAFRLLLKVAEYFRRAEPHSVVSYGLEQVVRWGKMSLPELLRELIADEGPREQLFKQVGIRPAPERVEAAANEGLAAESSEPRKSKWAPRR